MTRPGARRGARLFLVALAAAGLSSAGAGAASSLHRVELSPDEQAYVDRHKVITVCAARLSMPLEGISAGGQHEGIGADLIRLVTSRVGLDIVLHPTANWEESLEAVRAGRCQVVSLVNQTPLRENWLLFTEPALSDETVIVTRRDHPQINDLHEINGETVATVRGSMVAERLRGDYPGLTLIETDSESETARLVSQGRVDMAIRPLTLATYTIRSEGLFDLKIAGRLPELPNLPRIGVSKSEPELRAVLDRGVASITDAERAALAVRYTPVIIDGATDYRLVAIVVLVAATLLTVSAYWNRKLTRLNRELDRLSTTDRLTNLSNRLRIDDILEGESARTRRYGVPFSVILLDLDHFKDVNDAHGHQVGDAVLVRVASLLRASVRTTDTVGRWGGEEFIIVCPHTPVTGAAVLAENLCARLAQLDIAIAGQQTASFGVAECHPDDRIADVVGRADAALYEAKRAGRNRIHVAPAALSTATA